MYFVIKEIQSKFTRTLPILFTRLLPKLSRTLPMLSTRTLPKPFTRALRQRTPPHTNHMSMFTFALTFTPPHVTHMPIPMLTQSTHHPHITRILLAYPYRLHIACTSLTHRLHITRTPLAHRLHIACTSLTYRSHVVLPLLIPASVVPQRHFQQGIWQVF